MKHPSPFVQRAFFVLVLLSLLLSACAGPLAAPATPTAAPTATTAPTDTPTPTATASPTATATATSTPRPTATATPNRTATLQAAATAEAQALLKEIEPNLTTYGYKPEDGHLVWSRKDPMEITVKEYGMSRFFLLDDAPSTDNFIIQTEVTWNTTGGLAGCGLFFRMEDGTAQGRANQFEFVRLLNAPAWNIGFYDKGQFQRSMSNWVPASVIEDKNDSTNIIALVVDGRNIYPYINGKKQRLVEDITLKEGMFAISATQDSGVSTCSFANTWIWRIDQSKK